VNAAGLILAAGESRRMGSPKALLPYRGETFLDTLVGLLAPRCEPVIVVLGASADAIRARSRRRADFVINPDYRLGQTSSMQCGLRAVPPETDGILFTLVDHPAVAAATVDKLIRGEATKSPNGEDFGARLRIRVPRYEGHRGHPIWFSRELISEFLALPPGGAARDVVARHRAETEFLDLDDPGITADIDDPETFRAFTGHAL
jgi:molybdenum cofactor cytidylyltransferase